MEDGFQTRAKTSLSGPQTPGPPLELLALRHRHYRAPYQIGSVRASDPPPTAREMVAHRSLW